jgi:tight adherence protein B
LAAVSTLVFALFGGGTSAWLARRARRYAVVDRLRPVSAASLPPWLEPRVERMLDAAAIDLPAVQVVQMWLVCALVVGIVGAALDPSLGGFGVLAVLAGGPTVLHAMRQRRARAIGAAVPDTLERVAAELRAGGTVAGAIAWLAHDDGPLRRDFARLQARAQLGASIPQGLRDWAGERPAAGTRSVAGALAVAHEQGGRAADALESLGTSLRERRGAVAEAHALSAQARYSALVVGLGPLIYFAFTTVVDRRSAAALVGSNAGRLCAAVGIAFELLGAWWMRRILAVEDFS